VDKDGLNVRIFFVTWMLFDIIRDVIEDVPKSFAKIKEVFKNIKLNIFKFQIDKITFANI
jgi:hypothetical protein